MGREDAVITVEQLLTHAGWLQRLAARLVDPSTAEDVVQETWEAALHSPPQAGRSARPWLATVLRNLVRNRARDDRRWEARAQRIAAADDAPLPTAEDLLAHHQAQRLVAELVAELEEPYRSTVLLCYGQGLLPSEVASRQAIAAGTVRWRLKRGLDDLRAKLDARYGGDRKAWGAALAPLAAMAPAVPPLAAGGGATALKLALGIAAIAAGALWLGTRDGAPHTSTPESA